MNIKYGIFLRGNQAKATSSDVRPYLNTTQNLSEKSEFTGAFLNFDSRVNPITVNGNHFGVGPDYQIPDAL